MLSQTSRPPEAATGPDAPGLTAEDRRHLLAWTKAARERGIDATEDLRLRPWPIPVDAAVIGVFRTGEDFASWLVVGQGGQWTVVAVTESTVLATRPSLPEALAIIYPFRQPETLLAE